MRFPIIHIIAAELYDWPHVAVLSKYKNSQKANVPEFCIQERLDLESPNTK